MLPAPPVTRMRLPVMADLSAASCALTSSANNDVGRPVVRRLSSGSKNREAVSIKPRPEKPFISCPILAKGGHIGILGRITSIEPGTLELFRVIFKVIGIHSARS